MTRRIVRAAARPAALALALVLALLGTFAPASPDPASAHPLGNFTVNRLVDLQPDGRLLRVTYVLDYAEIPGFGERGLVDTNQDGVTSQEELDAYVEAVAQMVLPRLWITAAGQPVRLAWTGGRVLFFPGEWDLDIMRVELDLEGTLPGDGTAPLELQVRDATSFVERVGWKEIVARDSGGWQVTAASVPNRDKANRLFDYPDDLLADAPDEREARFTLAPDGTGQSAVLPAGSSGAVAGPAGAAGTRGGASTAAGDPLTRTITGVLQAPFASPWAMALAVLASVGLGAFHALGPGHGKAVVGAWLVGTRGRPRDAVVLGLVVTATHTAGVFALGLVTLVLARWILPEQLYPWLTAVSGLLLVLVGAGLLRPRWEAWQRARRQARAAQDTAPPPDPLSGSGPSEAYAFARQWAAGRLHGTTPGLATAGIAAAPRLAHDADGHLHSGGAVLTPAKAEEVFVPGMPDPLLDGDGHGHEHAVPAGAGWRSLVTLGVSGGLVPCPSALVILLAAIAAGNVLAGLGLVVAFSLGLATVLTGLGLAVVAGGRLVGRAGRGRSWLERPWVQFVPIASAALITAAGVVVMVQAILGG